MACPSRYRCAIEIQRQLRDHDAGGSEADPIRFRIGINVGDIIIEGDDILGDGVDIAARIEGIAEPGGISISEDAWRQVQGKVVANFVDAGEQSLKIVYCKDANRRDDFPIISFDFLGFQFRARARQGMPWSSMAPLSEFKSESRSV